MYFSRPLLLPPTYYVPSWVSLFRYLLQSQVQDALQRFSPSTPHNRSSCRNLPGVHHPSNPPKFVSLFFNTRASKWWSPCCRSWAARRCLEQGRQGGLKTLVEKVKSYVGRSKLQSSILSLDLSVVNLSDFVSCWTMATTATALCCFPLRCIYICISEVDGNLWEFTDKKANFGFGSQLWTYDAGRSWRDSLTSQSDD